MFHQVLRQFFHRHPIDSGTARFSLTRANAALTLPCATTHSIRRAAPLVMPCRRSGSGKQNKKMEVMAMAINKVIVIGNLGANPNVRALPSAQNAANFSLATTERFTDRNGA